LGTLPGENSHYILTFDHEKTFLQKAILKYLLLLIDVLIKAQVMPSDHNAKQSYNHLNTFIIFTRQKHHF
jgi:hypothetical protein